MTIVNYRTEFMKTLEDVYDETELSSIFYLILEEKRQLNRVDLVVHPEFSLTKNEIEAWDTIINQLKIETPIQYILGKTHFMDLEFVVNENVLIPRPETEELVDWIIQEMNPCSSKIKFIDIGTGSGCIAISLALNLKNSEGYAIDISEKALSIAQENAKNNKVEIEFIQKDILQTDDLEQSFDVIVSNPPYVRNLEKAEIKNNVLNYEPHLALFVADDNALIFYRKIGKLAIKNLAPNGKLFFEINQYLGTSTKELLTEIGFKKVVLRKDIYGNDRMILAEK